MGSWDVYCAICGGPLGSPEVARCSRRLRKLEREQKRKEREQTTSSHAGGDQDIEESEDEDDDDDKNYGEDYDGYDPDIISEKSLEWLEQVRVLGFNPNAAGIQKSFISGRGKYNDYGEVDCLRGDDPNVPDDEHSSNTPDAVCALKCYYSLDENIPVFPFHDYCFYELLSRALTGSRYSESLDKDLLYNILAELTEEFSPALSLSYGEPGPSADQLWDINTGEEVLVANPLETPDLKSLIGEFANPTDHLTSIPQSVLQQRVTRDPFVRVPYDILHTIFKSLPGDSIRALMIASWHVHLATRPSSFWKQLIRSDMPWLWEVQDRGIFSEATHTDYRRLYLFLDGATKGSVGMHGPLLGLANRRRIWGVCEQLAGIYSRRIADEENEVPEDGNAKAILDHSISLQMPAVLNPAPKQELSSVSTQWVRSWKDIDSKAALFETFWDPSGSLIGLTLAHGNDRRLFGRDDGDGTQTQVTRIASNDWIEGFILHMTDLDFAGDSLESSIRGIEVFMKAGKSVHLGAYTDSRRPLIVSEGRVLVGVTGKTGAGLISRLGLLECPRPRGDDFATHDLYYTDPKNLKSNTVVPLAQKWLWKGDLHMYLRDPVYAKSSVCPLPYRTGYWSSRVPFEFLAQEPLLFAKNKQELQWISRVSARVLEGGLVYGAGQEERIKYDICGFRVEYTRRAWEPKRYIGKSRHVNAIGDEYWSEDEMRHFDIDGPGGEYITAIEIGISELPKAVKIRTNKGREGYLGDEQANEWDVQPVPEGRRIVGLTATFGHKIGKKPFHLRATSISALTMDIAALESDL